MSSSRVELTTGIVTAYLSNNAIKVDQIPALIEEVYKALRPAHEATAASADVQTKATPAQIRKSITEGGLVNFEDGKTYQSLKRNLSTRGMTPDDYRAKWGLPHDYPMVSPAYAARRSELAKSMGLGSKGGRTKAVVAPEPSEKPKSTARKQKAA